MPLKSLIVVALRLYAIYWLYVRNCGHGDLPHIFFQASKKLGNYVDFEVGAVALVMFFIFVVLWFTASWISARVTKGHDVQLTAASLTLEDIYRFAFVVLGLYFLLSSIVSLTQTGYRFFSFDFNLPDMDDRKGTGLANLTGQCANSHCRPRLRSGRQNVDQKADSIGK